MAVVPAGFYTACRFISVASKCPAFPPTSAYLRVEFSEPRANLEAPAAHSLIHSSLWLIIKPSRYISSVESQVFGGPKECKERGRPQSLQGPHRGGQRPGSPLFLRPELLGAQTRSHPLTLLLGTFLSNPSLLERGELQGLGG